MGKLENEVQARGLDEHHGVRVKKILCGVSIDLQDVVIESKPSFGRLTSGSDLIGREIQCGGVNVSGVTSNIKAYTYL